VVLEARCLDVGFLGALEGGLFDVDGVRKGADSRLQGVAVVTPSYGGADEGGGAGCAGHVALHVGLRIYNVLLGGEEVTLIVVLLESLPLRADAPRASNEKQSCSKCISLSVVCLWINIDIFTHNQNKKI
jgi:hypothetical protein